MDGMSRVWKDGK